MREAAYTFAHNAPEDAKNVTGYTLDIVDASDKADDAKKAARVVGSCEGGAKKITYAKK